MFDTVTDAEARSVAVADVRLREAHAAVAGAAPRESRVAVAAAGPDELIAIADGLHTRIGAETRRLFAIFLEIDRSEAWAGDGARDMAHWISMRYGVSSWKGDRWLEAARALESLPITASALSRGTLNVDKAVELARFARPETEAPLVRWAQTVSAGSIRRRAELERSRAEDDAATVDAERRLRWWLTDEGRRLELMAELPAAEGAIVVGAIERMAADLPESPGVDRGEAREARRADALVSICTGMTPGGAGRVGDARPHVVVHAPLEALTAPLDRAPNALLDGHGVAGLGDGVIGAPVLRRLACDARFEVVLEDARGEPLSRAPHAGAFSRDRESRASPRSRVSLSRMRRSTPHRPPSRRVVVPRRAHRRDEPAAPVWLPPPSGARAWMEGSSVRGRRRDVVETRRNDPSPRPLRHHVSDASDAVSGTAGSTRAPIRRRRSPTGPRPRPRTAPTRHASGS
jgi:hypothetical protein